MQKPYLKTSCLGPGPGVGRVVQQFSESKGPHLRFPHIMCSVCRPRMRSKGLFLHVLLKLCFLNVFCRALHLGGFGSMQNTPTGCGDVVPTILVIKKIRNVEKSKQLSPAADFLPNQCIFVLPAKALPS